jgi:hypothetical protein
MKIIAPKRLMASVFPTVRNGGIFNAASLDLQFARTKTLDSRITFTRASSGTFVGSDGLLKTATTNEARFDHNPTTGESLGLLVEEARTNLLLQSEDLGTTWAPANTTVSTNQTVAPDGVTTADKILETATTTEHNIRQDTASQSAGTYTFSIFAKAAERSNLQFAATGVLGSFRANFNLATGTLGSVNTELTASIIPYPNNWYRCVVTRTTTASGTLRAQWNIVTSDTAARVESYAGDITKGLLIWGAQLEAGAFATSYIPTTTATATRAADVASITGTNFSSFYNQTEGTFFVDSNQANVTPTSRIVAASNNATANRIILSRGSASGGNINFTVTDAGIVQVSTVTLGTSIAAGTSNIVAAVYKAADFAGSVNGLTPVTQGTGTVPGVLTQLTIGNGETLGSNTMTGTIKRLTYWPQRLSNSTLQAVTQ